MQSAKNLVNSMIKYCLDKLEMRKASKTKIEQMASYHTTSLYLGSIQDRIQETVVLRQEGCLQETLGCESLKTTSYGGKNLGCTSP